MKVRFLILLGNLVFFQRFFSFSKLSVSRRRFSDLNTTSSDSNPLFQSQTSHLSTSPRNAFLLKMQFLHLFLRNYSPLTWFAFSGCRILSVQNKDEILKLMPHGDFLRKGQFVICSMIFWIFFSLLICGF